MSYSHQILYTYRCLLDASACKFCEGWRKNYSSHGCFIVSPKVWKLASSYTCHSKALEKLCKNYITQNLGRPMVSYLGPANPSLGIPLRAERQAKERCLVPSPVRSQVQHKNSSDNRCSHPCAPGSSTIIPHSNTAHEHVLSFHIHEHVLSFHIHEHVRVISHT